jgi:hypothetical protein
MFSVRASVLLSTALVAQMGCMVHRLPAPPPPNPELPSSASPIRAGANDEDPPTPSHGRLVITSDVPAKVVHVANIYRRPTGGRSGANSLNDTVCERTPCTITLEYGHQQLRFTALADDDRTSKVVIHVHQPTTVVNHTLGQHRVSKGRVGGMLIALAGAAIIGIGLGLDDAPRARAIAIGASAVVGGGLLWGLSHETVQEGATTEWAPQPAPGSDHGKSKGPVLGTSFGIRF